MGWVGRVGAEDWSGRDFSTYLLLKYATIISMGIVLFVGGKGMSSD